MQLIEIFSLLHTSISSLFIRDKVGSRNPVEFALGNSLDQRIMAMELGFAPWKTSRNGSGSDKLEFSRELIFLFFPYIFFRKDGGGKKFYWRRGKKRGKGKKKVEILMVYNYSVSNPVRSAARFKSLHDNLVTFDRFTLVRPKYFSEKENFWIKMIESHD